MFIKVKIITFNFYLFFVFNSVFGISYSQIWEPTISFPGTPRDDATYFKIGSKHYIGTGREVGFGYTSDFYFFDETTLSWGNASPLTVGNERQYASSIAWNGKGYLFGGVNCAGVFQNDFWNYDPLTNSWTELDSLPSSGRAGMVHFVLQDTLYVAGGRNESEILDEVWAFNFITQTWSQKNSLPTNGIWRGIAFQYQENAYIGLGKNNLNNQTDFNSNILKYDVVSDVWQIVPNLNLGKRSYVGYTQTDSLLFLFGGVDSTGQILTSVERINLSDFSINQLSNFSSIPRKGGASFLVSNDLYYSTGVSTDTRFNETWRLSNVTLTNELNNEKLIIFPNPASDKIVVSSSSNLIIGKDLIIQDLSGKSLLYEVINSKHQHIDISDLKNGVYIMTIGTNTHKIVIQ